MLAVVLTVVLATAVGVVCEHRAAWAGALAARCLTAMLYVLVPFVSYANFAHLKISLGGGIGLLVAYAGLGLAGGFAYLLGRRSGAPRRALGALILGVILANTGYLGYPMSVALLGPPALPHAVVYDQLVSGPMVFTVGFAVGAAFGTGPQSSWRDRGLRFLTRNPPLIAAVAGLVVPKALAPEVLVTASHVVVNVMLAVGFLVVGIYLASEREEDHASLLEVPDKLVWIGLGCRFLINPVLLAIVYSAGVAIPSAYLLQAAMPAGINGLIVGHAYGLDQRRIATMIVWSTLLALLVGSGVYLL